LKARRDLADKEPVHAMKTPPRISILLPVYNAGDYLVEAVESVLAQSFTDFELLALNDGSTDGSGEILHAFEKSDPRVRVVSRPNHGLVKTLNELIELASAPLLARMDADDVCLPDRLELQAAFLDANPEVVCVGGAVEFIDEAGRTLHRPAPVRGDDAVQREALCGRTPICHPASIFRAEAIRKVGGYRASTWPAEDLDLWLRLGELGALDNVPECVLRYRLHAASISFSKSREQLAQQEAVCRAAWRRRGVEGEFANTTFEASGDSVDREGAAGGFGDHAAMLAEAGLLDSPTARGITMASGMSA